MKAIAIAKRIVFANDNVDSRRMITFAPLMKKSFVMPVKPNAASLLVTQRSSLAIQIPLKRLNAFLSVSLPFVRPIAGLILITNAGRMERSMVINV